MNINATINPAASVYDLVRQTKDNRTLVNSFTTMQVISSEIENVILQDGIRARVFTGFERVSGFLSQQERYRQIAQNAESVYVLAAMDVEPPRIANVHYVPVQDNTPLIREWFLVVDSAEYFTALCAEEKTDPRLPISERHFEGVWSFDEEMVTIIQEWLTHIVKAPVLNEHHKRRNHNQQVTLMSRIMTRLVERVVQPPVKPMSVIHSQEINQVIWQQLVPSFQAAANKLPILQASR